MALDLHLMCEEVAFFDHVHGVDGQAANGIELHPVLSVRFR
jgi:hypothetical protein